MINMDFAHAGENFLFDEEDFNAFCNSLHWGEVDFEELFRDAGIDCPSDVLSDILANDKAGVVFDHWMDRKLSEAQKFLIKVNYGKEGFPEEEEIQADAAAGDHYENKICLEFAFDVIRENMAPGKCLYHILSDDEIGGDFGRFQIDVDFKDQWLFLTHWYGDLHIVDGGNLSDKDIFECISDRIEDRVIRSAIYFALCGEGEFVFDDEYRLFGVDADDIPELYEKCWDLLKENLTDDMIAGGLEDYIQQGIWNYSDQFIMEYINAASFALYVFKNGIEWNQATYPHFEGRGWEYYKRIHCLD